MNSAINIFKLNIKMISKYMTEQFLDVTQEQVKVAGAEKNIDWICFYGFMHISPKIGKSY